MSYSDRPSSFHSRASRDRCRYRSRSALSSASVIETPVGGYPGLQDGEEPVRSEVPARLDRLSNASSTVVAMFGTIRTGRRTGGDCLRRRCKTCPMRVGGASAATSLRGTETGTVRRELDGNPCPYRAGRMSISHPLLDNRVLDE